jgi:2-succinyl-5-enolpyruvyl-6-hydroxy-3-cyclohexene-1-carboxylate synthase
MQTTGANLNSIWADLMIEQLRRSGVTCFSLAPGSRSTPLVAAIARRSDVDVSMHVDERGAAFFAVGYARATGRPAAFITTSGTAGANGYPAIIEASQSLLSLVVITADRPAELRATGANQTIDQVKLFGGYVRWFFDLPAPDTQIDPRMVLTTIAQAVHQAQRTPQGPVHLNAMFREPLAPGDDSHDYGAYLAPLQSWLHASQPFSMSLPPRSQPQAEHVEQIAQVLNSAQRGLVVVGELQRDRQREAVINVARKLNWPLLPDINSGLRLGTHAAQIVPYYDHVLASQPFAQAHQPDVVLHIGSGFVSKRLLQFLDRTQPTYIVVKDHPFRYDPNHQVMYSVEADIELACAALLPLIETAGDARWLSNWQHASTAVDVQIERFLDDHNAVNEPAIARTITRMIPADHALFIGNSMPVRDMDMFAVADGPAVHVSVNRGASGIDGNLASAAGFARGLARPATLLIGDLSLLHDLNSLLLARNSRFPLMIVAINNDGGGIFSFLPIAQQRDMFEPYFGTPQHVTFEHAAHMFDLCYVNPTSMAEFEAAYRAATMSERSTLIEVVTDRQENYALHSQLREQVIGILDHHGDTQTRRTSKR